jgi:hypothetical protein
LSRQVSSVPGSNDCWFLETVFHENWSTLVVHGIDELVLIDIIAEDTPVCRPVWKFGKHRQAVLQMLRRRLFFGDSTLRWSGLQHESK